MVDRQQSCHSTASSQIKKICEVVVAAALSFVPMTSFGQVTVFGGNQYQTFSSSGTTNGAATNGAITAYVSVGQPVAVSSANVTMMQAGILSAFVSGIAPRTGPVITPVVPASFVPNSTVFVVGVKDVVAISNTQFHYKPIGSPASAFDSTALTATAASSPLQKNYSQVISNAAWYDAMGLEYYYSATDVNGVWSRVPASGSFYASLVTAPLALSTLTTLPAGTQYKMVSFPYDSGADAFSAPGIYKVTSDQSKARMFHWDTSSKKYFEYATGDFSSVVRGAGYWLLYATAPVISLATVTAPSQNRNNLFKIILKAKSWNQIGNPYPLPISWNDVLALDLNKSVNAGDLSKLNTYNGTSYDSAANGLLSPFEGGFIENLSNTDVTVYLPFQGQTQQGGRTAGTVTDISSSAWNIYLHIQQDAGAPNVLAGFGMNPNARLGPDRHDNYNPPSMGTVPEVNFSHTEYPGIAFGNDIVPSQNEFQWSFIATGEEGKETELTWNEGITAGRSELYLFDPANLSLTNMLTTDHYQFMQRQSHAFQIYVGTDVEKMIRPSELNMAGPFPNPLQQNKVLTFSVAVPDNLPVAGASLQFFNSTGELVGASDQSLVAGLQELSYSLGNVSSSGIYLYRMAIRQGSSSKVYTGKIIVP